MPIKHGVNEAVFEKLQNVTIQTIKHRYSDKLLDQASHL